MVVVEWRALVAGQGSGMTGDRVRIESGRKRAQGASLARLEIEIPATI